MVAVTTDADLYDVVDLTAEPWARSFPARVSTGIAASSDLVLRNALSGVIAASMVPLALGDTFGNDQGRLDLYRELAATHDPTAFFEKPPSGVTVWTERSAPLPFGRRAGRGRVETIGFESPFVPVHPDLRDGWREMRSNRRAHAQHWRHDDGPRSTLVVIHGFMGSPYFFNSAFFSLPWFYAQGYDVLLVTLPFHGTRKEPGALYSGQGLFAGGISHLNESIAQSVSDLRVFFDHLESQGVQKIGMTGLSLGGYTTAITAAVDERVYLAIPNSAVTDFGSLIDQWGPMGKLMRALGPRAGVDIDHFFDAVKVHSGLNYPCLVPHDRRFIIAGLGDRVAPPEQSLSLWHHWDQPKVHWFPGNHVLHVNRASYLRRMRSFMEDTGFGITD